MLPLSILFNFMIVWDDRKFLLHLCCGYKDVSTVG